jgi:1-acyl-sn-glycerol-3-phosphate acyltransferase
MKLKAAPFPFGKPTWPTAVPRPAPERRVGVDYDHEWSRSYPVRLARAVVLDNVTRPAARLIAPTTVRGAEHLRHVPTPVIFAANHASHLDTPLLLTTLPVRFRHRTVVAAAADYFFDRRWKAILWSFGLAAIPIERARVNRRSADVAAELLSDGWNLVIFPEGGRSPHGWAQPFRGGAAYLARRTGRPVVPVHVNGTRHVLPKAGERRMPRRSPVSVVFGTPLTPDEGEDARRFAARIETTVATLADEVSSDWWSARKRAARGDTPSLRGPETAPWRRSWALDPRPEGGRDVWPRV